MSEKTQEREEMINETQEFKTTSAADAEKNVTEGPSVAEIAAKGNNSGKKDISRAKTKALFAAVSILIYTVAVVVITAKIDRKIIEHNIRESIQDEFNTNNSLSKKTENEDRTDGNASGFADIIRKDTKEDKDKSSSEEEKNKDDKLHGEKKGKNSKEDNSSEKKDEKGEKAKELNLNEMVTVGDVMELVLENYEWAEEVRPSNPDGVYSYYEDNANEKYIIIRGKVKNIAGENLDLKWGDNKSQVVINDKYKAKVIIECEESGGTDFCSEIKPLQTLDIVAFASFSDEVYDICKDIRFETDIVNDSEHLGSLFIDDVPHDSFYVEFEEK